MAMPPTDSGKCPVILDVEQGADALAFAYHFQVIGDAGRRRAHILAIGGRRVFSCLMKFLSPLCLTLLAAAFTARAGDFYKKQVGVDEKGQPIYQYVFSAGQRYASPGSYYYFPAAYPAVSRCWGYSVPLRPIVICRPTVTRAAPICRGGRR